MRRQPETRHQGAAAALPSCAAPGLALLLLALCTGLALSSQAHSAGTKMLRAAVDVSALERRTRVITTHSQRRNGTIQESRGSGVVVGRYFLTVHHNLKPDGGTEFTQYQSYLDGVPVKPVFVDPGADLAIITIPEPLCATWCGQNNLLPDTESGLNETVRWYRPPASAPRVNPGWRKARVLGRTWSLPQRTVGSLGRDCDSGLVLEIDQPFRPGSSGAGIWDTQNKLVGIAQGSFQTRDGRETGYFKPLRCIRGHWPAQMTRADAFATLTGSSKRLSSLAPSSPGLFGGYH